MTFALTRFEAYGIEIDEPLQKRWVQRAMFVGTAANTNVSYDFGTYAGTYWTAVGSTAPGTTALKAIKDIALGARAFLSVAGLGITGKELISSAGGDITSYNSAASAGGAATEALAVTGLAAADTILGISQQAKGANSTALNLWTDAGRTADILTVGWTANPGAGAIVRVIARKAAAAVTPVAGQYSVSLDGTNTTLPNVLFASGDAPTSIVFVLQWELQNNFKPVYVTATA